MEVLNETLLNLKQVFREEGIARIKEKYQLSSLEYQKFNIVINYTPIIFSHQDKKVWGSYDSNQDVIIIDPNICFLSQQEAIDIYLHEICHAYFKGNLEATHGKTFKKMCRKLGVTEEAIKAKVDYDIRPERINDLSGKVKKLLAMAESSNQNESEVAMQKAYLLLNKYNLNEILIHKESEDLWQDNKYIGKRKTVLYRAIAHILSEVYHVYTVYNYNHLDGIRLNITGEKTNVEIATYVFDFLQKKLPELYKKTVLFKEAGARASFFFGFKDAFVEKYQKEIPVEESTALVVYQEEVEDKAKSLFYKEHTLTTSSSYIYNYQHSTYNHGYKAGQNTNINPGVRNQGQALLA